MAHQRGQVPGPHEQRVALLHVQLDVAARGEQVGLHADEQPVGVRDDHVRRMPLHGVGPDRGTHLAHDRRGSGAVPLHVPDDQGHLPLRQRDHVVPVAAHLESAPGGQVAGHGGAPGQPREAAGQQAALEHRREFLLGVVGVRALQGLPHQTRRRGEQGPLLRGELVRGVPADQAHPGHLALRGQRQDREAAGPDPREARFQHGAGRPQAHPPVPQRRLQRGQHADRRVGPLRAPLRTPQLRPGGGGRRIEHGDREPVLQQLGECDPVGTQRLAQRGDHHAADVPHRRRVVERGRQPLDPGDVAGAAPQHGGRGDDAQHPLGSAVGTLQHAASQAQPAQFTGGAADTELQLPAPRGLRGRFDDRHQGRDVLRDAVGEQGVSLAVETVLGDADEFEQGRVRLDQAGARRQGEGAHPHGPQGRIQQR